MDAHERLPVKSMLAEVLYDARDVNSRKIILDRGTRNDVTLGLPVIDNQGVVGQVTRVHRGPPGVGGVGLWRRSAWTSRSPRSSA